MAYGLDSGYGTNGGGEQDSQASQAQQIQKQRQTPYAAKTGQALANQQKQVSTPYTRGAANSPVTGDGKINEQNGPAPQPSPAQPPAQAQPAAPAPQPATPTFDPKLVGEDTIKGIMAQNPGWTRDDALTQAQRWGYGMTPQTPAPQAPGTPAAPNPGTPQTPAQWNGVNAGLAGVGLPGRPANTQYAPGTLPQYQGGAWGGAQINTNPYAQYGGTQYAQWNQINQQPMESAANAALMNAINGPGPIDPELHKAAAKDDAMAMMSQLGSQSADAMAARGLSGGGADAAAQARINEEGTANLLKGYRDINMNAATQNRAALMQALGQADTSMNSAIARGTQQYDNTLKGQGAQAQDWKDVVASKNAATDYDFKTQATNAALDKEKWDSGITAHQTALQGALAQEGLDQGASQMNADNYKTDTQNILAKWGIDADKYKTDSSEKVGLAGVSADRYGHSLNFLGNMASILEGARANDMNTGINWAKILTP